MDFIISILCLIGVTALGLNLAVSNHKRLQETHDVRMEAYRRRKKLKNEALKRFLGL